MSENQNLNEETVLEEEVKTEETVCEEKADKAVNEQTAPEPETDENSADGKKEKKASKKKSKEDKKTQAMQEKIDELEDRVRRQMAEFENFRKRTDKEKAAMFETGA